MVDGHRAAEGPAEGAALHGGSRAGCVADVRAAPGQRPARIEDHSIGA
jgi:hypothetical protein